MPFRIGLLGLGGLDSLRVTGVDDGGEDVADISESVSAPETFEDGVVWGV